MKEDILKKFGTNSTGTGEYANDDLVFPQVKLSDGSKSWSFYTYKGDICILDDRGMDNDFDDYSIEDQTLLYNVMMSV